MMRCICYKIRATKTVILRYYYDIIKYTITVTIYRTTTTEGTVYDLRACVIATTE